MPTPDAAAGLVAFWRDAGPSRWFSRDDAFDAALAARYGALTLRAARGELDGWLADADAALALVLLLDQLPRNLHRGSPRAFETDAAARRAAAAAIDAGFDRLVDPALRVFFYLPFEHSESMADQERSLALFEALGDANYLRYAVAHADCIRRFGRFPYRNAVLGRATTAAEQAWLDARVPYSGAG